MRLTRTKSLARRRFPCEHVGLFVTDIGKVSRFYIERLGFKIVRDYVADTKIIRRIFSISSPCRLQFLVLGDFGLELLYFTREKLAPRKKNASGINHWTLLVEDKFRFCRNLKKRGVKVIKAAKPSGTTFFIKDPERNLIEIKSYDDPGLTKKRY